MKKFLLLLFLAILMQTGFSQQVSKNSLSTMLLRREYWGHSISSNAQIKFFTGLEYQRYVNRWSFGVRFEHGLNGLLADGKKCSDCLTGIGYLREHNVFLTANYSILSLFESKLKINTGMGVYFALLNYSGSFQGGLRGGGARIDKTYRMIGIAPNVAIVYSPVSPFFITLNTKFRIGTGKIEDAEIGVTSGSKELMITAPELCVGVRF